MYRGGYYILFALQIGLEDWEIAKIRMNLMAEATPADLKMQQTTLRPRRSIFAFYRRSSSQHDQLPQARFAIIVLKVLLVPVLKEDPHQKFAPLWKLGQNSLLT